MVHTWFLKGGGGGYKEHHAKDRETTGQGIMINDAIISVGYSKDYWEYHEERENFGKCEDYIEFCKRNFNWDKMPMKNLYESIHAGDIVWTRVLNIKTLGRGSKRVPKYPLEKVQVGYWVTRLEQNPRDLFYCCEGSESNFNSLNNTDSLVGIGLRLGPKPSKWYGPFSEDEVPGSITRHIWGSAIVRADEDEEEAGATIKDTNDEDWTYTSMVSQLLLEEKLNEKEKENMSVDFEKVKSSEEGSKIKLFKLIGWYGLEDVVALWLQKERGYYFQASSCKIGTAKREYVLVDPKSGKRVSVQAKNSEKDPLTSDEYRAYISGDNDEFYLISLGGIDGKKDVKIKILRKDASGNKDEIVSFDELINFVFSGVNDNVLPTHIKTFRDYLYKN